MKTNLPQNGSRVALTVLLLAASLAAGRADLIFYQNTFDDSSSFQPDNPNYNPPPISIEWEYGSAVSHSVAWVTNDAGGNPSSGSVQCSWTWDATQTNGAAAAFRLDLFPAAITNASAISFDLMLAPTPPQGLPDNDHGYFQWVTRDDGYGYNVIGNFGEGLLAAAGGTNVWTHVTIPLSGVNTNVRAITFQDYNDQYRQIIGTETIYIDNFSILIPGATVPPTNYISPAGTKGLYMLTSVNSAPDQPQYQRQGIRTANSEYSWLGSGANPVTYALTIASFPPAAHSNFEAYIFLVPTNSFTGGPVEANPDWTEPTIASLNIQNNADGTATAQVQYKVGSGSANETFLANVSGPSVLGTWSITFSDDDNIIIAAPGGATFSTNFPAGTAAVFGSQVGVYIGTRPNDTNNTGQQNIFSQFQMISNGIPLLNETFSTPTLSSTWAMAAEDQTGILQVPPSTAYLLSWTLPDAGFSLQLTTNLNNSGAWHSPGLTKTTFNGKSTVLIPSAMVATNHPALFRLIKP